MNLCYVSDVDISIPDGPGVNEREFLSVFQTESEKQNDQAYMIIPTPVYPLDFALTNPAFHRKPYHKKRLLPIKWILQTPSILQIVNRHYIDKKIDLFILRMDTGMIPTAFIMALRNIPFVIKTLGDIQGFGVPDTGFLYRFILALQRRLLIHIFRKALFIDVCTPQLKQNFQKAYNLKNIEVIDNAVNTERFYLADKTASKQLCGFDQFDPIVGYCGGFPSERGARQLVGVAGKLMAKYPRCGILIIGDDNRIGLLKKTAFELGVIDHIVFAGTIPYQDLPPYINCMDLGIGLDTSDKIRFVGNSSQKIRQYLACGVPVICAKGTNERIVRAGLGSEVASDDLDDIFQAICYWLDNKKENSDRIRSRARRFALEELSVLNAYKKRYELWKKALNYDPFIGI